MQVTLTAYKRNKQRMEFVLNHPETVTGFSETIVGRSRECDLRVNDSRVSRRHCRLLLSARTLKVVDLSSVHGTYVNGRRVEEAELVNGDRLSIGRIYFEVKLEPELGPPAEVMGTGTQEAISPEQLAFRAFSEMGMQAGNADRNTEETQQRLSAKRPQEPAPSGAGARAADSEAGAGGEGSLEAPGMPTGNEPELAAGEKTEVPVTPVESDPGEAAPGLAARETTPVDMEEETMRQPSPSSDAGREEAPPQREDSAAEARETERPEELDSGRDRERVRVPVRKAPRGRRRARARRSGAPVGKPDNPEPRGAREPVGEIVRREAESGMLAAGGGAPGEGFFASSSLAPAAPRTKHSVRNLLRYKWSILLVTILVAVPPIATAWALIKPQYKAAGQIRIRPYVPHLVFRTEDNGAIRFYQSYMNSQIGVIRSPRILQRVLAQPAVQATAWYDETPPFWRKSGSRMERLQEAMSLRQQRNSELIYVSIRTSSGKDSAVLVNAVLDEYSKYVREISDEGSDMMFRRLDKEYSALKTELEGRGKVVADLRKQLGTGDPGELVAQKRVRIDGKEAQLDTLRRTLAMERWRQKELRRRLNIQARPTTQPTSQPAPKPRYEDDPEYGRLQMEARSARHAVELQRDQLGQAHPTMVALVKRAEFAEELLRARQAQLDQQWRLNPASLLGADSPRAKLAQELEETNARMELLVHEEGLLVESLKKDQGAWEQSFDKAQILAKELEVIHRKELLQDAVRNRLEQKRMERNVPGATEILSRAVAPTSASGDRRVILTAVAIFGGLAMGIGLAFLRAGADPAIHQAEELLLSARVPFLGQLPQVPTKGSRSPLDDPFLNEGIRMVRTSLLQRIDDDQGNVVLITSAGTGEGKTTMAVMLARSLAQCGKEVLLVDADLRSPNVGVQLGIDSEVGFLEALTSQVEDGQAILKSDSAPRLSVLPAGRVDHGIDPELIANGAFSAAIARWREKYDVVLLDSPPVLPVADARILARHADGTILVVWAERTWRADVVEALSYLDSAGGRLWGSVFVGSPRRRRYGYAYNYGSGKHA